jgi:bifunctional NMN adenylyltransferase/nudix hydrolase
MTTLSTFIGRCQSVHGGHLKNIKNALENSDFTLILLGSANRPRSGKNPWTYEERVLFIKASLQGYEDKILFAPADDFLYDDEAWIKNIVKIVESVQQEKNAETVILTGFPKDSSTSYLKMFPQWQMLPVEAYEDEQGLLNATDLRALFYAGKDTRRFGSIITEELNIWKQQKPNVFEYIKNEYLATESYKTALEKGKKAFGYDISVPCVDAFVTSQDKVLLIQRNKAPGAGLWALPGGHIDAGETSRQALLRELGEETGFGLKNSDFGHGYVFDHPQRSERGWIRTEVFAAQMQTPDIGTADGYEIRDVKWFDIDTLDPLTMFEDHYDIIQEMKKKERQTNKKPNFSLAA